ncbi:MAG: hypothetical protein GC185_07270 [Alphaproteobacteria bacterium]|nr:hypothetical protein [Alphaproteobacteria bacterium]
MTATLAKSRQAFALVTAFKAALAGSLYASSFPLLSALFFSIHVTASNKDLDIVSGPFITLLAIGLPLAALCLLISLPVNLLAAYGMTLFLSRDIAHSNITKMRARCMGAAYGFAVYAASIIPFLFLFRQLINGTAFFRFPFWLGLPVAMASGMMTIDISLRSARTFSGAAQVEGTPVS